LLHQRFTMNPRAFVTLGSPNSGIVRAQSSHTAAERLTAPGCALAQAVHQRRATEPGRPKCLWRAPQSSQSFFGHEVCFRERFGAASAAIRRAGTCYWLRAIGRRSPANAEQEQASPGHTPARRQPKVSAFARRWAGLVLTRRNDYVLKFD
jgi:hypothetical protein